MTIIKPPYEQVLVGMGWIAGGPRETKEEKEKKKRSRRRMSLGQRKARKTPRRRVSPRPSGGVRSGGVIVPPLVIPPLLLSSLSSFPSLVIIPLSSS